MVINGCDGVLSNRTGVDADRSQDFEKNVAALAAESESSGHWYAAFHEILQQCVSIPAIGRGSGDPRDVLADFFGLRVGTEINQSLARNLANLLLRKKSVALDLGSCTRRSDFTTLQHLQHIAVAVAHRGVSFEPEVIVLDILGADLDVAIRTFLDHGCRDQQLIFRISDAFLKRLNAPDASKREGSRMRWMQLVTLMRAHERVNAVLSDCTAPVSPLAHREKTDTVCPGLHQMLPSCAAQLIITVHLDKMVGRARVIDRQRLRHAIEVSVRMADNLLDSVNWPLPEIAVDARRCRRIALHLTGVGDMVRRLGLDAGDFATLEAVERIVRFARHCAYQSSVSLARLRGPFPALGIEKLQKDCHCPRLRERVRDNIARHGTRHSRLIALGPYDLIPRDAESSEISSSLNLLPVLRYADSLAFRRTAPLSNMSDRMLDRLLRLTGAYWRTTQTTTAHKPI